MSIQLFVWRDLTKRRDGQEEYLLIWKDTKYKEVQFKTQYN